VSRRQCLSACRADRSYSHGVAACAWSTAGLEVSPGGLQAVAKRGGGQVPACSGRGGARHGTRDVQVTSDCRLRTGEGLTGLASKLRLGVPKLGLLRQGKST
jgi:hypothetical protein